MAIRHGLLHLLALLAPALAVSAPAPRVHAVEVRDVRLTAGPAGTRIDLDLSVMNAEVGKMIKAFGAPIGDADAKDIAAYLAANYGT